MKKMKQIILAMVLCTLAIPSLAIDLSIDQNQQILLPDGKPKMACDAQDESAPPKCTHQLPLTVAIVIQEVLGFQLPDPSGRGGNDPGNAQSGSLAIRMYGQQHFTLKLDEAKLILARVDRMQDPITIARMHDFLEPVTKTSDAK
jgi:hypothetical protein